MTVAGISVFAVIGAASKGHKEAHLGPVGAADGKLSKTCEAGFHQCTSPDAARALKADSVWCYLGGDHVYVHAILTNPMTARARSQSCRSTTYKTGGSMGHPRAQTFR